MKIGAADFYGLLTKSPVDACLELQKAGIRAVELMYEYPHIISEQDALKLKKLGLDFSMHGPFTEKSFSHPHPDFRGLQVKMVEKSLDIAAKVEADSYVIHGGLFPSFYSMIEHGHKRDYFYDVFANEFQNAFKKASEAGIRVVVENLGLSQIGGKFEDIIEIKRRLPETGFCLDLAHALMSGGFPLLDAFISEIKVDHFHVSDGTAGKDEHWAIGKGHLPIRETLQKLKKKGYDGKVIFEGLTLTDTLESVKKLREMVK